MSESSHFSADDPYLEVFLAKFWARIREEDAREAAGEPVRTPEQDAELLAYAERVNDFTALIPPDASIEEIMRLADEAGLQAPHFDDTPQDFKDSN